jgi:hypothetical protein|nr:MAG TPA: hypothetical protein [Caudoviricetes sp.]
MDYSQQQIEQIEEYAGYLTKVSDMAALMGIDEDILRKDIADKHSPVSIAYRKAKAQISLSLRKQEIELATVGSPLAVQLTSNYLLEMDDDEDS